MGVGVGVVVVVVVVVFPQLHVQDEGVARDALRLRAQDTYY